MFFMQKASDALLVFLLLKSLGSAYPKLGFSGRNRKNYQKIQTMFLALQLSDKTAFMLIKNNNFFFLQ